MKRRANSSTILARPAGPRLRCFLSAAFWMLMYLSIGQIVCAQVDIPGPERLKHVDGIVVNPEGHPATDLDVALVRDGKVTLQTKTNESGGFHFEHVPSGPYTLRVARTQYAPAVREIVVTDEIVTVVERKKLYVILGPGACQDACSSVLTSKKEFDREIRKHNRRGQ